jgi:hypothetical protein
MNVWWQRHGWPTRLDSTRPRGLERLPSILVCEKRFVYPSEIWNSWRCLPFRISTSKEEKNEVNPDITVWSQNLSASNLTDTLRGTFDFIRFSVLSFFRLSVSWWCIYSTTGNWNVINFKLIGFKLTKSTFLGEKIAFLFFFEKANLFSNLVSVRVRWKVRLWSISNWSVSNWQSRLF